MNIFYFKSIKVKLDILKLLSRNDKNLYKSLKICIENNPEEILYI